MVGGVEGNMKAIYLTGFMGAGKTTIGRALGKVMELDVIDTDQFIEEKVGKTIQQIFDEDGEAVFREYENTYLKKLPLENVIITTGGGIILQKDNQTWMKDHGTIVYLHCDMGEIFKRLKDDTSRPLLTGDKQAKIQEIFSQRQPLYHEADVRIDTTNKQIDDIINEIVNRVDS